MDITVIVALLAAISAIIAPAITSIINNRHALKVIKIEKFIASRINIIEKYVSTAGQLISHPSHESRLEFGNYCSQIYLYVPYTYWEDLDKLSNLLLSNFSYDEKLVLSILNKISKDLANYLQSIKYKK